MSEITTIEPKNGGALTPMELLQNAVQSRTDPETLGKLLALQERWEANQARKAYDNAMADLRADLPDILKSSEVDYTHNGKRTHYKYEDLSAVTRAIAPSMAKCGLSFRWRTKQENGGVIVTCIISHRDGHYEETSLQAAPDNSAGKNSIQSIGSTVTYLQRYTLKAAVGVAATHDDDGQASSMRDAIDADYTPSRPTMSPRDVAERWGENRGQDILNEMRREPDALYAELMADIESADSEEALRAWAGNRRAEIESVAPARRQQLRDRYADRILDFKHGPAVEQQEDHAHV